MTFALLSLGRGTFTILLAPLSAPGQDGDAMEITERPPMRFDLPRREEPGYIATQRWVLEVWEGEDPPGLAKIWARKPKFSVNSSRSRAELAIVHHLRDQGWHGIWVNSFGPRELRSEWFPAPAAKMLAETGAPSWAVEAFDRLRAANGGSLGGFFDVFAWREPGQVRFAEAKAGTDRIKPTQLRFVELALRFHRLQEFTIAEVAGDRGIHDGVGRLGQRWGTVRTTRRLRLRWAIVRGAQGRGPGILASRPAAR